MKIILTETETISNNDIDFSALQGLGEVTASPSPRPMRSSPACGRLMRR